MYSRNRTRTKDKIRTSISKKLILGWSISIFIPVFIIFIIMFVQNWEHVLNPSTGKDVSQKIYPLVLAQISEELDDWTHSNPAYKDNAEIEKRIMGALKYKEYKADYYIERHGSTVTSLLSQDNFSDEQIKMLEQYLPPFGESSIENSIKLLSNTDFVLYTQKDFYYSDGAEGTIFVLFKYPNLTLELAKFVGSNLALLIGGLLVVHFIMTYVFMRSFTNPLSQLLEAMKSYQSQNFTVRLNEDTNDPMFKTINTSVNEMAEELLLSQKRDKLIEQYRVEFLANISHDTKTPLASIRAHAEALRDDVINEPEKRQKYINNILKKVESIDNMINELSLYSNLEAGIDQYDFSRIDLNYYFIDILDEFRYDYPEDLLEINYSNSIEKNIYVDLDVVRFKRVLMNIIKNSVWYSGRNKVTIDIQLYVDTSRDRVTISIKDNGKGISEDSLSSIFNTFVRGDASRNPNQAGSGLGLAIAKTIVEKHDGSINAKSKIDEYFNIIIELPIKGDM